MRYCITSQVINDDNDDDDGESKGVQQVDDATSHVYLTLLQQIFQDIQIQDNWIQKFIK